MQLIFLDTLKEISGYSDLRSIRKWMEDELGICLLKVGKNWCAFKEDFEKAFAEKYQSSNNTTKSQQNYKPRGEHEKRLLKDLQKYTTEL